MLAILQTLADSNRRQRLANLETIGTQVRSGSRQLTHEEGTALFQAWQEEGGRPEFDMTMYRQVWSVLEFAPAVEDLAPFAHQILEDPKMGFRGHAARYLLRAYPDQRGALIALYGADPDPEVRDAMQRASSGAAAWPSLCADCWQLAPRAAESNALGPAANLELNSIVNPHPRLTWEGAGQPRHIHESEAALYHCRQCGAWWDICLWHGVGFIYIDERSAGWVEKWKNAKH